MLIKWRMFRNVRVCLCEREFCCVAAMTGKSEHKTFISHMHHYSLKPVNFTENEQQQ